MSVLRFDLDFHKLCVVRAIVAEGLACEVGDLPRLFFDIPIAEGVLPDAVRLATGADVFDLHGFLLSPVVYDLAVFDQRERQVAHMSDTGQGGLHGENRLVEQALSQIVRVVCVADVVGIDAPRLLGVNVVCVTNGTKNVDLA